LRVENPILSKLLEVKSIHSRISWIQLGGGSDPSILIFEYSSKKL